MSTTYHTLLRTIAHAAGALRGDATVSIETSYIATPLTKAEIRDDTPFSFTALIDALLQGEQDFVMEVATTGNSPFRRPLIATTTGQATNTQLPLVASNGKPIVGEYGSAFDTTDGTPMIEMPLDVIARRNRNANTHYVTPVYYYKFDGSFIYHTRPLASFEVCTYNRADQATAVAANGAMLLGDVLGPGIVARALSYLVREGVEVWRQYGNDALVAVRSVQSIPERSIPVPITNVKAN